jgi:hypothetical protein
LANFSFGYANLDYELFPGDEVVGIGKFIVQDNLA